MRSRKYYSNDGNACLVVAHPARRTQVWAHRMEDGVHVLLRPPKEHAHCYEQLVLAPGERRRIGSHNLRLSRMSRREADAYRVRHHLDD